MHFLNMMTYTAMPYNKLSDKILVSLNTINGMLYKFISLDTRWDFMIWLYSYTLHMYLFRVLPSSIFSVLYILKTQSCFLKQCNAANTSLCLLRRVSTNTKCYATFSIAYIRPRYDHAQHTQIDRNIYWWNKTKIYKSND